MLTRVKNLFRNVVIYGMGDVATSVVSLLLLPIFTSYLTPADYGVITMLLTIEAVAKVMFRWGVDTAFMRLYYDCSDRQARQRLASTIFFFLFTLNGVLVAAGLLSAGWLSDALFHTRAHALLIRLTLANTFVAGFFFIPFQVLRIGEQSGTFVALSFTRSAGTIVARLLLVIVARMGVLGIVAADLVVTTILSAILTRWFAPLLRPVFSRAVLREALGFGLPRVPHSIAQQIIGFADRYFLNAYATLRDVGIFSIGASFGLALKFFLGAFESAWTPFFLGFMRDRDAKRAYSTVSTYVLALLVLLVAGVCATAPAVVRLFTTAQFHSAAVVTPWIALGVMFQGIYLVGSIGLVITKKTKVYPLSTGAAAVASVVANVLLIPRYGILGAAWANAIAYATLATATVGVSWYVYPIQYEWRRLLRIGVAGAVSYAVVSRTVPRNLSPVVGILVSTAATTAMYVMVLTVSGFFQPGELRVLRSIRRRALQRNRTPRIAAEPTQIEMAGDFIDTPAEPAQADIDLEVRASGPRSGIGVRRLMVLAGLALSLALAWLNFLLTPKWAALPGALNGPRWPWYGAALLTASVLAIATRREVGRPVRPGRTAPLVLLAGGAATLSAATLARLPIATWRQIPFKDDWTELFQQALNGVHLLQRGSVVGWNWWLQGGYPTSTDIAQNFSALALAPMTLFGDRLGYHLLHVFVLLALPAIVWWDLRHEDRDAARIGAGFACLFTAGYFVTLGNSGDTNSLMGVFSAALALAGSRAARLGRRWGGAVMVLGLTFGLYSHPAFFVYALIFLALEALYFRDRTAAFRLAAAALTAVIASVPIHWESLRYAAYVSFNNTVYDPAAQKDWPLALRTIYYNVEMLAFPHRWFNDYRSLSNVWLPALIVSAIVIERSRAGFYVCATLLAQVLLRFNTSEAGAIFDRIQHMLPILAAPALAGFVVRFAGTRRLATALMAVIGLYVATSFVPIRHVPDVRAWDPALIDRIAAAGGNMILVEISPHRDMDADPVRRTPTTPFDVHFEGLLPGVAGQRFYSQMIDGWVFNRWRGEVLAAGTWAARPIDDTPVEAFVAEMRRWGVKDLFVWTDRSRGYLARSGRFAERWRGGLWSQFEMIDADTRSVVTAHGRGALGQLDFLGGTVALDGVAAGDPVIVRAHYYPAWRAFAGPHEVALYASDGQLAFRAPEDGSYVVRLDYPRYRGLSIGAAAVFLIGAWGVSRLRGNQPAVSRDSLDPRR